MSTRNCYTYLIGWTKTNKWYYGVRYAKNCDPSDLWKTYFTSSKFVKKQRDLYGDPDIISIRKTFGDNSIKAKLWEERVLENLDVIKNEKWLNQSVNNSFRGIHSSWNDGLTKETCPSLKSASLKISEARINNENWKTRKGSKNTTQHNEKNSFSQLKKNNDDFENYEDFSNKCVELHEKGFGVYAIATQLEVGATSVKTALKRKNINNVQNQSWTKIKKRHPDFPFNTYEDFCAYCQEQLSKGRSRWCIVKELKLSECTIQRALDYSL